MSHTDILEVKHFLKPPPIVKLVCECVAVIMGLTDLRWEAVKDMMTNDNFVNELNSMDWGNITPQQTCIVRGKQIRISNIIREKLLST